MAYKDFASLKKAILNKAKEGMEKEVLNTVKTVMRRSVYDVVYSWGEPSYYARRKEKGGLADENNVKGYFTEKDNGFVYTIKNETLPSSVGASTDTYLTPLVVMGQIKAMSINYPILYHEFAEYYPYGKPRDFIAETKNRLRKNNYIKNELEKYMKS